MAIFPGTEPTLEAASTWKARCLLSDGSALEPGSPVWTLDHIDELVEHFVGDPKTDSRRFLSKLEEQVAPTSPEARKLASEMIWVLMLFPSNFNFDTKLRKIRESWEFSGDPFPDSDLLGEPLDHGIGSAGPGFVNHQPDELGFLILWSHQLKKMPREDRAELLDDPWRLVAHLDAYEGVGQRQLRHIIPHLLHPEHFERIASWNHKREILKKFGRDEVAKTNDLEKADRALLDLRRELEEEYPDREHLDYYRPPLIERWKLEEAPGVELIEEAVAGARDAFQKEFPDFKSFAEPGVRLKDEELGYKRVLREHFLELVERLPAEGGPAEDQAVEVVSDLRSVLTKKLDPYDHSQNLIGWRYTSFLKDLEPSEAVVFVRALVDLLDSDTPSPARIQRFIEDVWPVLEAHDASSYGLSRSLPTLFLWLSEPDQEIYVRTNLFDELARELTGDKIFLNKRMDMNEYQRALAFAEEVRGRLEDWGWEPRDMIDVQTFMWRANEALKEQDGDESSTTDQVREPRAGYGSAGSETTELQEILDLLEGDGFHFPPELVANYVLALQTKRFAILTGISGTGKTKLAIKVAEFFAGSDGGSESDAADRILVVAVRPDWTDPRGLIGYFNPISNQYLMTKFLNLLLDAREEEAAAKKEDRPSRPFFVVLDEMNLARVEHYFSDFLSALESGRGLALHHGADQQIEATGSSRHVPAHLRIPRNVFFTGTVNVDETTHMFSPKVLDRAFTLELNEVDLDGWALGETDRLGDALSLDLPEMEANLRWHGQPGAEEWKAFGDLLQGKLREAVTGLNSALAQTGFHFGYRVAGEIASFVLMANRQGATSDAALWKALDLAVLEKVLPKFNGTEQELREPLRIVAYVARQGRAPSEQEIQADLLTGDEGEDKLARLPRCEDKVHRMQRRLQQRGFAAFIE